MRLRRRLPQRRSGSLTCRLCDAHSDAQLVSPTGSSEFLCREHLGEFIWTWTDPAVKEWTVVRL